MEEYYQLLDESIAALLRARTPGRVLLVSDHGFGNRTDRYPANPTVPFTGEHRLEGTIIAAGQDIVPGRVVHGATLYDVAPTVAEWLGLRITNAEGHSLNAQLTHEASAQKRKRDLSAQNDPSFRSQELDRLRSLGYVQ
jgi:predicted AlkP superfamily phosphohydrolase/phosphomutase